MEYIFSPSEIDYKTKCKRCFYLLKNNKNLEILFTIYLNQSCSIRELSEMNKIERKHFLKRYVKKNIDKDSKLEALVNSKKLKLNLIKNKLSKLKKHIVF